MRVTRTAPFLCLLPGLLLSGSVILFPLFEMIRFSTHSVSRFGKLREFVGWENYFTVLASEEFNAVLMRTGIWVVVVVGGTVLISVPLALILNQDFYGKGLAKTIILLPWSISLTMTAILWKWTLNGEYGMLNHTLAVWGWMENPIFWLAEGNLAFGVEMLIGILVSIPFTVMVILGGLSSISPDSYDSAKVEGAGRLFMFRSITLPLLKPFLSIVVVLSVIYVFNSFPIIWVMTQGGPAGQTDILVTYLYKQGFRLGKLGEASALSVLMFGMLLALITLYLRILGRNER